MADTPSRQLRSFLPITGRVHLYKLLAALLEAGYSLRDAIQTLAQADDKDSGLVETAKQLAVIQQGQPDIGLGALLGHASSPLSPTVPERILYQVMVARPGTAAENTAMLVRLLDRAATLTA